MEYDTTSCCNISKIILKDGIQLAVCFAALRFYPSRPPMISATMYPHLYASPHRGNMLVETEAQ